MEDDLIPHILIGSIFYIFGLKWCCEYAKFWETPRRSEEMGSSKSRKVVRKCEKLFTNHPIEGSLKLIATAIGLIGTMVGGLPNVFPVIVSPKVVHATIYLFFAFSGLIDVLTFYFPRNITKGLANLALAQSFFVEGFLFVWASPDSTIASGILAGIVWTTAFTVGAELIWPDLKLLRAATTLLHGGWIAHMVRAFRPDKLATEIIALAFSWHIAAAFAVTLIVVATVRSCVPTINTDEPPEVPIYDYCNEPHDM
ncbi:transmembrane protein 45B [Diachasma alloeum]|uniref:transmembrane protein 45B n=1 Tax=Diachasma alloeum TaxID=454923 RepID=UPI0007380FED|nr:transmembrane protein 45B [Diachasma alloeum]XP_015118599.1 transmembrane protein 45B [Diachasma alloeum]